MSRTIKGVIGIALVSILDTCILFFFGWKRMKVVDNLVHYVDPDTGDYWLKDKAVEICESRARNQR